MFDMLLFQEKIEQTYPIVIFVTKDGVEDTYVFPGSTDDDSGETTSGSTSVLIITYDSEDADGILNYEAMIGVLEGSGYIVCEREEEDSYCIESDDDR
jgi:uncharacterized protein YvpB